MHSGRLPPNLSVNAVSRAVAARRTAGLDVIDLTESNPTAVGLDYPPDLLAPLADPAALRYDPRALGLPSARAAIAHEWQRHGRAVDPEQVALTASTSEAYSLLFKLFCDPGDHVLVPQPSYPLFDHLTRLEAVVPDAYTLEYHGAWRIDVASIARAVTPRTRALLVVSPNNPTGSFLHRDDLAAIVAVCRDHQLALVGDEVFFDYVLEGSPDAASVLDQQDVLSCSLGGLSKSCGLPQVKLGWIVWGGPPAHVSETLAAYDVLADSYLSVSTPVQVAAPSLLAAGASVRAQITTRTRRNLSALQAACAHWPAATVLRAEGGWTAVVQVPATQPEDDLVVALVSDDGVLVHPGYFFDFSREAFVVVSLLVEPSRFDEGVRRVLARSCGGCP